MLTDTARLILLVEPEQILAEITQFRLELLGFIVRYVMSAEEALEYIAKETPDVIICDLTLPGMGGLELIEQLASDPATSDIPIMALSIEADIESVQRAHKTGVADYLVAPYQPTALEEKVTKLISRRIRKQLALTK